MNKTSLRHSVPDMSGEAATRAGNAISEGRLRARGMAAQAEVPDAPLYQLLSTIGWSAESMEMALAAAHAAIDERVVPKADPAVGSLSLAQRVAELMALARAAGDEVRMLRGLLRGLADHLGVSPERLLEALMGLCGGGDGRGEG